MKGSVIYREIYEEGKEEGKEEGRELGRDEGLRVFTLDILRRRFQTVSDDLAVRLESVRSFERLEDLAERATTCDSLKTFAGLLG